MPLPTVLENATTSYNKNGYILAKAQNAKYNQFAKIY